jgi:GT2 family glycosyltransferase
VSLPQDTASGSPCTLRESPDLGVFVVVVNWNGGDYNLRSIRSLLDQGLPQEAIVFVDNGSTDGSREKVLAAFPEVRLIANQENLGFGDGVNQGTRLALEEGAEFVFLSNNDIEFPPGTLRSLLRALERNPGYGVVGPRVLYQDDPDTVWAAGGALSFRQNLTTLIGHKKPDRPGLRQTVAVDFVPGCAMLIRRSVLERSGLMEGDYFAYLEDVDFCVRATASGFGIACVGAALALHSPHHSTGGGYNPRRKYMMAVNAIWFLRRHGTPIRWLRFVVYDVLTLPPLYVAGLFNGRSRAVLAKLRGTLDGARGRHVTAAVIENLR